MTPRHLPLVTRHTWEESIREIATSSVEYPSNGITANGYLARPKDGSGSGVVVIRGWWWFEAYLR
ncbi:MAG: hypothetical protein ACRDGG_01435 [Anaerolineae bacterium]